MNCKTPVKMASGIYRRCGTCIFCRITTTFEWKIRLLHELQNWDSAMFVTLTFNDEHLGNNNLSKQEFSGFHKRLRKHICLECEHYQMAEADSRYKYNHCGNNCVHRIKFYGCGEYCPTSGRKHYHDIIFGLSSFVDKDRQLIVDSWKNCDEWQFDKNRGKKSAIGSVTPDSIQYVTGYVRKKLGGDEAKKVYGDKQKPFALCSKGLGKEFLLKHQEKLLKDQCFYVSGKRVGLPRYYREKLGLTATSGLIKEVNFTSSFNEEDYKKTSDAFDEYYLTKFGEPDYLSIRGLDHVTRQFEKWYDDLCSAYTRQIFNDFYQREKMRTGKIDGYSENCLSRRKK